MWPTARLYKYQRYINSYIIEKMKIKSAQLCAAPRLKPDISLCGCLPTNRAVERTDHTHTHTYTHTHTHTHTYTHESQMGQIADVVRRVQTMGGIQCEPTAVYICIMAAQNSCLTLFMVLICMQGESQNLC